MRRRIFITGGTGFFGKSMLDYRLRHPEWEWSDAEWVILSRNPDMFAEKYPLLALQEGIVLIEGDVRDFVFPQGRFDAIIHAATSAMTTLAGAEMMSVILDGTKRVIDFAKASNCKTMLFTSSGAVYGSRTTPACEEDECRPDTVYGTGKLMAEKMLVQSGLDVKLARCFAFVGPYLNRQIHYAIGNFIQSCLDNHDILIKGDGTPLRSYLHADDLVEWLFVILSKGHVGRPYNVGSSVGISIMDLAKLVKSTLATHNISIKVIAKEQHKRNVYVPIVDRAKNELKLSESISLCDAIVKSTNSRRLFSERMS